MTAPIHNETGINGCFDSVFLPFKHLREDVDVRCAITNTRGGPADAPRRRLKPKPTSSDVAQARQAAHANRSLQPRSQPLIRDSCAGLQARNPTSQLPDHSTSYRTVGYRFSRSVGAVGPKEA